MMTYIFLSLSIGINSIVESVNSRKDIQRIINIMIILSLVFISGTRYYLGGSDYYVYNNVFNSIPLLPEFFRDYNKLDDLYLTYGMENGYLFLNSLIKTLGFNFFGFTLFHSIFFYTLFFKAVHRYTDRVGLLLTVFIYKLFFYNTFISMRQSLTIAIFLYSLKYIEKRNPIKYFLACFICLQVHTASIILFPIYFINRIKLSKRLILKLNLIFIPGIVLSILNINVFIFLDSLLEYIQDPTVASKASGIVNSTGEGINLLHTLEYFLVMFLFLKNYDRVMKSKNSIIIKIFLLLLPIFTVFRGVAIITRLKDYFIISSAVILGDIYPKNSRLNALFTYIIIIYCSLCYFRFLILFDGGTLIPYESYALKGINIFK